MGHESFSGLMMPGEEKSFENKQSNEKMSETKAPTTSIDIPSSIYKTNERV